MGFLAAEAGAALLWRPELGVAADYPEALPGRPDTAGQAASIFYDDGRFGAYGEIELYGHGPRPGTGRLVVETWLLRGAAEDLARRVGLAG